jgi:hypothetical protein
MEISASSYKLRANAKRTASDFLSSTACATLAGMLRTQILINKRLGT